jgi:4-hydroxybenzoate polyprenyltransferase
LLVTTCHPLPTLAVTAFSAGLAVTIGLTADITALVVAAVLCGQLSIGWSNDLLDAGRDAAAERSDKPLAASVGSVRLVMGACALAVAGCVVLSLAVGVRPGLAHLLAVGCGWAYNLRLKGSAWSWAPFALAFGLLPVFVYGGLPDAPWPPTWVVLCAALLGVGAHLLNAAPDLDDDLEAGVRGAAVRLGTHRAVGVALVCFGVAAGVGVWGASGALLAQVLLSVLALLLVGAGLAAWRRRASSVEPSARLSRRWFTAALALVSLEVVLILLAA